MQQPEPVQTETNPAPAVSPTAPPKAGVWNAWSSIGLGTAIFSINSLFQALVLIVFIILQPLDRGLFSDSYRIQRFLEDLISNGQMLSLAIIVSGVAGVAATLLFIKVRRGLSIREYLALKSLRPLTYLALLGIFIALLAVSFGLGQLMKDSTGESDIFTRAYTNTPWPVVFWLAVVVFGPVFEEVLFRGFLFAGLQKSALGITGTIVLTGLVFALLHAAQYGAGVIAQIFILGIVFGVVRWKTGSLWSSIFLHGVWNLGQMVILAFLPGLGG